MLEIDSTLAIPEAEVVFSVSTSRGPGGQNVNRVRTRVRLAFNVRTSPSLSEPQRERILKHLESRINKAGWLTVESERHRTQHANRRAARERLAELLGDALSERPKRTRTGPSRAERRRRLEEKRQRGALKQNRGAPAESED